MGIELEKMDLDEVFYVKKVFNNIDPKKLPRKKRSEIQAIFNMLAAVGAVKMFSMKVSVLARLDERVVHLPFDLPRDLHCFLTFCTL